MSTIAGEQQELKPGFFSVTRAAGSSGKLLAFYNATDDTQFNVCYTFTQPDVERLGRTNAEGDKYALTVYPGETLEFVQGRWRGAKRSLSYGAPDKAWQEQRKKQRNVEVDDEVQAMRDFVKAHPRSDGRYTAEYMAELCVEHKRKFIDLTFPPSAKSLARDWEEGVGEYGWMRPDGYCTADAPASLFIGDIEPNDIDQGLLRDCYFLCALACLAEFPLLVRDAFSLPQHPELGLYRILVCKNGWWQVVYVDDYLPTKNRFPCFARNREEPNELWVALLEKAYAKLHGSFSAIRNGDAAHAVADLLGAPYQKLHQLPEWDDKAKLFQRLKAADEADDLMALGTPGTDFSGLKEEKDDLALQYDDVGLATGHSYSLLRVKEPQGHRLCMIRNPWGNDREWNGAWSDDSPLWTPELQKEVEFYAGDDGTFWMQWDDVVKYFNTGCVAPALRTWPQIRVSGNFVSGMADVAVLLHVKKPVALWAGFHQRDQRGLPTGDLDAKYCGQLLAVLHEVGGDRRIVAQTNGGTFQSNRDGFTRAVLEASEHPYMVLLQPFEEVSKSFTMSLFLEDPECLASFDFVSSTLEKPTRYTPANRCKRSDWSRKALANYQVRVALADDKPGMVLHTAQGESVDLALLTATAPKPAKVAAQVAAPKPKPKVAPTSQPASAPQPAPPAADKAKLKLKGAARLQIIVVQGRNLVAKDSNGLSDPYVTLKLKTPSGSRLENDQRCETRYLKETLNPVWAEVFHYWVTSDEVLCVKCWDKDLFGHDLMGVLNIPVATVLSRLAAGGPAIVEWYPLEPPPNDACGELQLAFSWVL